MKTKLLIEIITAIGSASGFISHFLVGTKRIKLLTFGGISLFTSICFGIVGYISGNMSLLVSQIGWSAIAVSTIVKNL